MKNFPFTHNDQTLWYSRSVACSMYLFIYSRKTKQWYVLVSKRGPGCPSNVGKWNVPGGYLDFDETLEECARRECYEETGVKVTEELKLVSISTDLKSKKQNIICSFYAIREVNDVSEIRSEFTFDNNEQNEVTDIDLWWIGYFKESSERAAQSMAFGHDMMIKEIFKKRVQIPNWKKWLIGKIEKLTKIDLRIS